MSKPLNPPPEDQMRSLVRLLRFAILEVRADAYLAERETDEAVRTETFKKIARLMDAVHNIPPYLLNYEGWDQKLFEHCLGSSDSGVGQFLHNIYRQKDLE